MSFDFYFSSVPSSGPDIDYLMEHNGCVLLSQLNNRSVLNTFIKRFKEQGLKKSPMKIFVDSGAFTAWTQGKEIDVENYINYINENKDWFEICAAVDSIPGEPQGASVATHEEVMESCNKTWENFLYMRSKMLDTNKLLYTFHIGEPWEYLKQALEYKDEHGKIKYIAFGGLVGKGKDLIDNFLKEATQIVRQSSNPNVKIHVFGVSNFTILNKYKLTSSDSTAWCKMAGYGTLIYNNKTIEVTDRSMLSDSSILNKNPATKDEFLKIIKSRGFTLQELLENYTARRTFNVMTFQEQANNYKYTPEEVTKTSLF